MDYSHGIVYTPDSVRASTQAISRVGNIDHVNVSYVHIFWVDLANVRRSRVVPIEHFRHLMKSNRPGVNIAKVGISLVYLMMSEGFSGIGEYLYAVDPQSLYYLSGVGLDGGRVLGVMGFFEEKDDIGRNGVKTAICPRTLLKDIADESKKKYSVEYLVGFESEFIFLRSTDPVVPSNVHQWSSTTGLLAGSPEAKALHEIAENLKASGLPPLMIHSEAAPGQYEVVSGPLSPLKAADTLVYTREIITHTAAKYGLHVTFAPRPFMTSAGSSAHAHVSVHSSKSDGKKVPNKLSKYEQTFLAGLLEHLPAVAAFTLPTPASYKRVADGVWSGGTYVSYGNENREAPVRLTNAASPLSRNFELRFIDNTANPHLALAAILGAALIGLRQKKDLTHKDCETRSAAEMSEQERKDMGITKRMPLSIEQARDYLKGDKVFTEVMGEEMVNAFLAVNKTLGTALTQDSTEEKALTRLVEFY